MGRHGLCNFAETPAHSLFKRQTCLEEYHKLKFSKQTCYCIGDEAQRCSWAGMNRKSQIFFQGVRKMSIRGIWKVSMFTGLMLAVCGCSTPTLIGTDAAAYSNGKLYAVSSQDLDKVYAATVAALKQLEIEVTETAKDVFYAKVTGKVADGNTITIRLEPGADNATNLRIKASRFGNEERSRVIYEKIKENL
jgi:hypothetical protein